MVESVLVYDTGVEIRDEEATATSLAPTEGARFRLPLLCSGDVACWVQNLTGFIFKREAQKLNLDFDVRHRLRFFSFASSLGSFVDELQKGMPSETGYGLLQFSSASVATWEQRFEDLKKLPENWDSYGASRISNKAIEKGKSILAGMTAAGFSQRFFIAPCPNGGVQIEWELPGKGLLLEIPPTGETVTYLLVETVAAGEEREMEETVPEAEGLKQLLQRISA